MIAPYRCPFEHEPRREMLRCRPPDISACKTSGLTQRQSWISSRLTWKRLAAAPDEHRAQLVLGAGRVELGLILELE